MSRGEFNDDIEKRLGNIQQLAKRVHRCHNEEDIHKLRVNYKKLRALLRMSSGTKIKLPKKFKTLYAAAGSIRDLQLHYKTINAYFLQYDTLPVAYLERIEKATTAAKNNYDNLYKHFSFNRLIKLIKHIITNEPDRRSITRWRNKNLIVLRKLISGTITDTTLHEIRKHIKDLMYAKNYMNSTTTYEKIAYQLGDFVDSCVLLHLLDVHANNIPPNEATMMQRARLQWEQKKELQKAELKKVLIVFR